MKTKIHIKFDLLVILLLSISSCNAQRTNDENNKSKESLNASFIKNEELKFSIKKVACDTCFPIRDIGYRVRVHLSSKQDSVIRNMSKVQWMLKLHDCNTDFAANILLYYLYDRDAFVLLYNSEIQDWRRAMKEDDIHYWEKVVK
jgi:hypothetical protein